MKAKTNSLITNKKKINYLLNNNALFIKFIYGLIFLNVVVIFLESYDEIYLQYGLYLRIFEAISVVVFTVEYLLRLWSADYNGEGSSFKIRFKFATSTFGLIDLISILPFYLPFFLVLDLRIVRVLRLFRLLLIFKLGRHSKSFKMLNSVFLESKSELLLTGFIGFLLLILSSTLMYYVENEVQPENFASIGHALWWAVVTLTSVGYGDVYPVTGIGKILGGAIALIGIGFVALPTGIISSSFIKKSQELKLEKSRIEIKKMREEKKARQKQCCPNCGFEFQARKPNSKPSMKTPSSHPSQESSPETKSQNDL